MENGLPEISYNISAGYVNVNLNLRSKFNSIEVFRGPINFCLRMNKLAPTNSIIIGQDLHAIFNTILLRMVFASKITRFTLRK